MSDFAELIATVEQVRAERYPSLPTELVANILALEAEHPEDRTAAMRAIKQAVLSALAGPPGPFGNGAPIDTSISAGPANA